MSLVEEALKKIRESRATVAAAPAPASASVTPLTAVPEPPPRRALRHMSIDRDRLRAMGYLPPDAQQRQLADQYRQIKRPLLNRAFGESRIPNGQAILVTSSVPAEGKTFTSVNLAMSMARERDTSVLLVDADIARPQFSRAMGIEKEPGLMDLLHDRSLDLDEVALATDVPGLWMMSAGRRSDNASEMLNSRRMEEVIARLHAMEPNRVLLFDSAPVLATSESRALANVVGQIVLVVRAGVTLQDRIFETLQMLGEGRSLGVVFNQSPNEQTNEYYYGSKAYGHDGEDRAPGSKSP